jgi:hypothetical protein
MEIVFDTPKQIVTTPEVKKEVSSLNIMFITDMPDRKIVYAVTSDRINITLWEGESYDAIGQWTDADVVNRINEIYI